MKCIAYIVVVFFWESVSSTIHPNTLPKLLFRVTRISWEKRCQRCPGPCGISPGKPADQIWLIIIQIRPLWCELWAFYWSFEKRKQFRTYVKTHVWRAMVWLLSSIARWIDGNLKQLEKTNSNIQTFKYYIKHLRLQ